MDVVYILGSGSLSQNDEIRYSIRSLDQHMLDLRDIYVVGEMPQKLPYAKHIPANDGFTERWKNAYNKVRKACDIEGLSDEFLLMNDDFFMLEDFMGAEWPFYALEGSNGGTCGTHSFHIHCPIRLSREFYKNMPFSLDQKACRSPRSFYGNYYRAKPTFCKDFILRAANDCKPFDEQVKGQPCFSISDSSMLYEPFRQWLQTLYPDPSGYESVI